jgi:serine/threonine protein kinase
VGDEVTTKCPKCHSDNPDTKQFCGDCGTQLIPLKDIPAQTRTLVTLSQEFSRGTTIAGRYEIIEQLGTGGMGSVYRVEDIKIHEDVAIKLIKPEIAADKKTIERFSNELKLARKIRHKNVCLSGRPFRCLFVISIFYILLLKSEVFILSSILKNCFGIIEAKTESLSISLLSFLLNVLLT